MGLARSAREAEACRRIRRHGLDRDHDAFARQGAARHDDRAGGRSAQGEPGRRAALHDRPDLCERSRAGRCARGILRIEPKAWAVNFNLPGKDFPTIGALAAEMPEGHIKFFPIDLEKRTVEFKPGIVLDLQPFPGTFAVGIDPEDPAPRKGGVKDDPLAPVSTLRPWKNGSNMDINELQEGSTIFLPVFQRGGLIWTGDSHCRQGNGEVNLTALECSYKEIRIQPIVRKDMKVSWPFIETRTHWIATGFNEDLNVAMVNATREAVDWLANQKIVPMSRYEAYGLVSMAGDCRVSQVVDVRKGVHCMIPKSIFTNLQRS